MQLSLTAVYFEPQPDLITNITIIDQHISTFWKNRNKCIMPIKSLFFDCCYTEYFWHYDTRPVSTELYL